MTQGVCHVLKCQEIRTSKNHRVRKSCQVTVSGDDQIVSVDTVAQKGHVLELEGHLTGSWQGVYLAVVARAGHGCGQAGQPPSKDRLTP